jgi:hypothetical protein
MQQLELLSDLIQNKIKNMVEEYKNKNGSEEEQYELKLMSPELEIFNTCFITLFPNVLCLDLYNSNMRLSDLKSTILMLNHLYSSFGLDSSNKGLFNFEEFTDAYNSKFDLSPGVKDSDFPDISRQWNLILAPKKLW